MGSLVVKVTMSKEALKDFQKLAPHLQIKFNAWVASVSREGLVKIRALPGYRDHPLKGDRKGSRAIYLDKSSTRAVYKEKEHVADIGHHKPGKKGKPTPQKVIFKYVEVSEFITGHDYKK